MAAGLLWTGMSVSGSTGYLEIAAQMVVLGGGLGLTSAPSTASIMDVLPPAKAGVGSAVNDTTRQVGGTLGVAVIGSLFSSIYADRIASGQTASAVPARTLATARDSLGAALSVAERLPRADAARFALHAQGAFLDGLTIACYMAGGTALAGAVAALVFLPGRRQAPAARPEHPANTSPALDPAAEAL